MLEVNSIAIKTNNSTTQTKKSEPINIPRNSSINNMLTDINTNTNTNLTLNANIFNPAKSSPPDYWKGRLEGRIKNYCANSVIIIEK